MKFYVNLISDTGVYYHFNNGSGTAGTPGRIGSLGPRRAVGVPGNIIQEWKKSFILCRDYHTDHTAIRLKLVEQ